MKKLLTIVVCCGAETTNGEAAGDTVEIITVPDGSIAQALKGAKGKYAVVCDRTLTVADADFFLKNLQDMNTDIICVSYISAFKTSVLKDVDLKDADAFTYTAFGAMSCKSLANIRCIPFILGREESGYSDATAHNLLRVAEEFRKVKSKLNKDVYTYVFDILCDRLVKFYMAAMLSIKENGLPAEKLVEFDNRLKAEIVLFLALEKRFTATRLQKLREKGFKISGLTAKKFKKILNK